MSTAIERIYIVVEREHEGQLFRGRHNLDITEVNFYQGGVGDILLHIIQDARQAVASEINRTATEKLKHPERQKA